MIKLSRDTLYVHPLPDHLAKHVTRGSGGAKTHLVYRKSKVSSQCHTKVGKRKALSYKLYQKCFETLMHIYSECCDLILVNGSK